LASKKLYPDKDLQTELIRKLGLSGEELEYRKLRTLLYQVGGTLPDGATANQLARLVLDSVSGKDFQGGS
jgi:hypothetical protein